MNDADRCSTTSQLLFRIHRHLKKNICLLIHQTMTSSSNVALNDFETFINKEGHVVNDSLGSHFEVLEKHLHAQKVLVVSVSERSSKVRTTT